MPITYLALSEYQLKLGHIVLGGFTKPLDVDLQTAGGEAHLKRLVTVLAREILIVKHAPTADMANHIAAFLRAIRQPLSKECSGIIEEHASKWIPMIEEEHRIHAERLLAESRVHL